MDGKSLVDVMTIGGPVAAIAVLSIWLNHKLVMTWIAQVQETFNTVHRQMGEVTEALRHINGKA